MKKNKYKIVLTTSGIDYFGNGETIDEALGEIGLTWDKIKAKGVVKVTYNGKTIEKLYGLIPLRRIFANKIVRFQQAKFLGINFTETAKPMNAD